MVSKWCKSLKWYRRGVLLFFTVISVKFHTGQKKSPILTKILHFGTVTPVWIHRWLLKWCAKLEVVEEVTYCFLGHLTNFRFTQAKKLTILLRFERFGTVTKIWIHGWLSNDSQFPEYGRGSLLFFEVIHHILGLYMGRKSTTSIQFGQHY